MSWGLTLLTWTEHKQVVKNQIKYDNDDKGYFWNKSYVCMVCTMKFSQEPSFIKYFTGYWINLTYMKHR